MPIRLQEVLHKLEVGSGYHYVKYAAGLLAIVTLAVFYDAAAFKNLSTQEAMDAAQLARNIAEGRGYTTRFVRPLSIHLVIRSVTNELADLMPTKPGVPPRPPTPEQARLFRLMHLQEPHPDLANPPLYPVLLAAALRLMPFDYAIPPSAQNFQVYRPDLWIAGVNQLLFVAAGILAFALARRLFDEPVAWASAAVFLGCELFWRFSVSGLSTMLLVVLVLGTVWLLVCIDQVVRASSSAVSPQGGGPAGSFASFEGAVPPPGSRGAGPVVLAALAGGLVALAGLTRYSFAWLIVPTVIFLATVPHPRRGLLAVWAVGMFVVVMGPWVVRNLLLSGAPFGTAGFAVFQGTAWFPGDELERTLNPYFGGLEGADYFGKLLVGVREIVGSELPRLGGSWVSAFFLVGLLVPFRSPTLGRMRWFLVVSLALFIGVQALSRTHLTAASPEINSENLLAVFSPLVWMFGVGLFFVLIEPLGLPAAARYAVTGVFCLISCLPLILGLLVRPPTALSYPPYYPPWIQEKSNWLGDNDLLMTDMPWATAWYGDRQSIWWSLKLRNNPTDRWKNDFYEVNDYVKRVAGFYLSVKTMKTVESQALWDWGYFAEVGQSPPSQGSESAGVWRWMEGEGGSDWAGFVLQALVKRQVPTGFPLRSAPRGVVPELFLTDSERTAPKTIKSQ
jgi:hypothetical protein